MYGRGNFAPQFGQGLQRPMPLYQQPPGGHPPPPPPPLQFQPGQRFPMQPVLGGLAHGGPPHGPGYPHMPSGPLNLPPHGPSNSNQSFLQRPFVHGGPPGQHPYPGGQLNFPYGTQNPQHGAPPPPPPSMGPPRALPPPPPPSMGPPRDVPPPPLQHPAGYRAPPPPPHQAPTGFVPQQGGGSHMLLPPQAPPPPPPLPSAISMVPDPPSSSVVGGDLSSTRIHVPGGSLATHGGFLGQNQELVSEPTAEVKTASDGEGTLMELPPPPPPPKPADEAIVRNIDVLCQFIAKNGSQFEEMACKNESGNPKFSFLVGGEPGSEAACAREYYLWMKKKCGLQIDMDKSQEQKNLSERHADGNTTEVLNSSSNMAAVHSPADSDVDMEDDITQSDKEPEVYTSGEDLKSELVSTGEVLEMQTQETMLLYARDSRSALDSNQSVKSAEDAQTKSEYSSGQLGRIDSPMRLIQNYASDDITQTDKEPDVCVSGEYLKSEPVSTGKVYETQKQESMLLYARDNGSPFNKDPLVKSEGETETKPEDSSGQVGRTDSPFRLIQNYASDDNSEDEQPRELSEAQILSSPLKSGTCDDILSEPAGTACIGSLVMQQESLPVQIESQRTSTKVSSAKPETDDRHDVDEPSNPNTSFKERYATGSSAVDTAAFKDIDRKDKRSTSTALKVDEFGRLIKEGISDSESDDTQRVRRRGRRGRSRTRSRSPSDRRRRRSPYKRKARRSRSRSWSPKRRRSRSRSPHRSRDDFVGENMRRGRAETQQCFDYLKGKCFRGASCRYLHHDVGKSESSRRYKGKQYQVDVASERNSGFDNRVTSSGPLEYNDMKVEKLSYPPDKHDGDYWTSKSNAENYNAESKVDVVPKLLHEEVENSAVDIRNNEGHKDIVHVQGASAEACQDDEGDLPATAGCGKTDSSAVQTSVTSPSGISTEPNSNLISNEPTDPSASITNLPTKISQSLMLPLASQPLSGSQQSTISVSFPLHSAPLHVAPPYPAQQSHYPSPPISAWNMLTPSQPHPPPHLVDSSNSGASSHFQQGSSIPLRNDFSDQMSLRAQSGKLAGNSHSGGFQYEAYHLPSSNVPGTSFAGPSLVRDDRSSQYPSHGHVSVGTFTSGVPPQPGLFPGDSNVVQPFPRSNMLPGDSSKQTLQNFATDPSHFVDVGQSRISAHYNPYASTFDQPLSSRFSSNAFAKERVSASSIKYDNSFSLNHGPIGDPYDPLFDSIEPSSKRVQNQDLEADNSDMLKVGSHQRVLDAPETKFGGVVATTSADNDEYGETADAEVGAVENGSLSDTDDDAIVAEGELEIDQIQSGGSNKKSKDSRSMKLFKVAVANFVKEVLKPQWRQGNMSKEVFKTIVKKTVDKVSGAMKNHRVPKSQAKIDHYIDSSRRKLTQLVEGYVSKYKS